MFGTNVSDMQSDVVVTAPTATANGKVAGTLYKQTESSELVDYWGEGYFLSLKFASSDWAKYDSVKVGLVPTYKSGSAVNDDSGLVEIISDPDKNGAFKITNPSEQKFVVVATKGSKTVRKEYDLNTLSGKEWSATDNEYVTDPLF